MKRIFKISTITLGIIGSLLLVASLALFVFKSKFSSITARDISQICSLGIAVLCLFFIVSSFVFSSKNVTHRFARLMSALFMGTALFFIISKNYDIGFEIGCIFISVSLLVYNFFDLLYRRIKLPQVFMFIPMICLFTYGIVNYIHKQSFIMLGCSVLITLIFVGHLCYKASRLSNNQENIENITK